ncbi:ATPase [Candidatus Microgenomates bacterium]|jgi:predicted RecB family endonuclease|nr:MAG: ATPase [Candidatus Microgenomates bacterium]
MGKVVNVIKADGTVEPFMEEKVVESLLRAGASPKLAESIVTKIKPHLYPNIPTFQIYSSVMKALKKEQKEVANRYNLKEAIMELGPSGYPFEKFVAGVLEKNGFQVETNKIIMGRCVSHEIDIIARRDKKTYMIECKFHNQHGGKTEIKTALYSYARFLDVKDKGFAIPWLITNTKVTQEVRAYSACVGMEITSWDYPETKSLREIVDKSGLHPVTSLTSLSKKQKQFYLERGIIFIKDLPKTS